jgi:ASC-1-like (ASCH) protein
MKSSDIQLTKVSKNFEFEKLSREIDTISDINTLKEMLKCYVKLYLKQQETVQAIGLIEIEPPRKEGEIRTGDKVIFVGGTKEQRNWGGCDPAHHLNEGVTYTVTNVEVKSQHTRIELKGLQGCFNSVLFRVDDE